MGMGLENTPSAYSGAPPDRAVRTVDEIVTELWACITRDGGLDEHEMQTLGGFFKAVQQMAEKQQAAAGGGDPSMPQGPDGATSPAYASAETSENTSQQDYGGGGY